MFPENAQNRIPTASRTPPGDASFPSDGETQASLPIFPGRSLWISVVTDPILARPTYDYSAETTYAEDAAHRPQRSEQERTPALGEKLRPVAAEITETRIQVSARRYG